MRVALVHDYLTQMGGAEQVLGALHELWPEASVLTSVVHEAVLPTTWSDWDIRAHSLGRLAWVKRDHRLLFPFYPAIFSRLGRQINDVDVVISDSSAWSHRVAVPTGVPHVCYCHSPARFLWNDASYLKPSGMPAVVQAGSKSVAAWMRRGDRAAASRVDQYVANSQAVATRIRAAYGVEAQVIYPPVDTARFDSDSDVMIEDWFLVVSRLVPHKRIDLAIEACRQIGAPLQIIGAGRSEGALRQSSGSRITFLGALSDDEVAAKMRRCQALIVPAIEDFGIAAVEAQAAGRPVVTVRAGGALETVIEDVTGLFVDDQTPRSFAAALTASRTRSWDSVLARENAARFDIKRFQAEMVALVEQVVAEP